MPSVVLTEGLTRDFSVGFWRGRPYRALDAVSLDVPAGEVFGLLGPNGAGKSTTLKLLIGLIRPTSGSAQVLGYSPGDLRARGRLGFLPENPIFYDHLTAEELLNYFGGLCGLSGPRRARQVSRSLDEAGLPGDDRRRPLRQLSKGLLQRVGLAQALVNEPEFVIFDEPMSGLDPIGRYEVRELILRLRDEGRTVLFSSHILSDAEWLCSRVAILSKGRLAACGTVADLTTRASGRRGEAGWEIVVAGLSASAADRLRGDVRRLTRIADDRYSLALDSDSRPEPLIAGLTAAGATLVSVVPVRTSLEDVFIATTAESESRGFDGPAASRAPDA
jgi:ABC-2 type transport system ATP-binding protein